MLDRFHDGVVDGVPSFGGVDALSLDCICPLLGLTFQGIDLINHQTVRAGPDAQGFASFRDLQAFDGSRLAVVAQEQGSRLLSFGNVLAVGSNFHQIPVALFWGQGTTSGREEALP